MHLQPLYRRGPDWGHRIHSAQWPAGHLYGPPVAQDALAAMHHVREFDCRMFALYFLLTESLATYLGYRITQHLLRGRGLFVLPRSLRVGIVFGYCALKISLIDYAFHGSLYSIVSTIIAFCFAVCTLVAIVFHFGPLQFVFADFRRKDGGQSGHFGLSDLLAELKNIFIKQQFHEYALEISTKHQGLLGPVATISPTAPGIVRVPWPLLGELELNVKIWNEWFIHHAVKPISNAAKKKKPMLELAAPSRIDCLTESRFVMLMLPSGLLIDILLKPATASLMYRVRREDVYPFELVVRALVAPDAKNGRRLYFCYAECAKLVGASTATHKAALLALLVQLNATTGLRLDVPLRALRCKDFIAADCHSEESFRRTRARRDKLSSRLESAFG